MLRYGYLFVHGDHDFKRTDLFFQVYNVFMIIFVLADQWTLVTTFGWFLVSLAYTYLAASSQSFVESKPIEFESVQKR